MSIKKIVEGVYALHADIRTTPLFEGVWGIPTGATLNSYIIRGDKTALIDCVGNVEGAPEQFEAQCREIGISLSDVDFLILNHLEPDHSGWIENFRAQNKKALVIATKMGIKLVQTFYTLSENLRTVTTGDTLDLGSGMVLSFTETPNVHWPETMMTYLDKEGILFSCDTFGGYGATGDRLFAEEFSPGELAVYEEEALRYYANIIASFSPFVKKAIAAFSGKKIKVIAPSHGLVWRKTPERIIDWYTRYALYNTGGWQEKAVCVVWGSMHGNTKAGLDEVLSGIASEGVSAQIYRVPGSDSSEILAAALKNRGLVFAMPTYEYHMFDPVSDIISLLGKKHITGKIAFRLGSWGWVGGAQKAYEEATANYGWEQLPAYEWQGVPKAADKEELRSRGAALARAVKA